MDTSAWYAAADSGDRDNARAKELLTRDARLVTTDHVLAETWHLLRHRLGREAAERFWAGLRAGAAALEPVTPADLEVAWRVGQEYSDQDFSIVDRTSFAAMERLGIEQVATFDDDFAVYRFGPGRKHAFQVLR